MVKIKILSKLFQRIPEMSETTRFELVCIGSGATVGLVLQISCRYYLYYIKKQKKGFDTPRSDDPYPFISEHDKKINVLDKIWLIRRIRKLRGGFLDMQTVARLITYLSEAGVVLGTVGGFISFVSLIPKDKLVSTLYRSLVQNSAVKSLISIEDQRIALERIADECAMCDKNIGAIILNLLTDNSLPFEQKKAAIYKILTKHMKFDAAFVLCILAILLALYTSNPSSYILLLSQLAEAVKNGKISKVILLAIIRKLKKLGFIVDPYMFD